MKPTSSSVSDRPRERSFVTRVSGLIAALMLAVLAFSTVRTGADMQLSSAPGIPKGVEASAHQAEPSMPPPEPVPTEHDAELLSFVSYGG